LTTAIGLSQFTIQLRRCGYVESLRFRLHRTLLADDTDLLRTARDLQSSRLREQRLSIDHEWGLGKERMSDPPYRRRGPRLKIALIGYRLEKEAFDRDLKAVPDLPSEAVQFRFSRARQFRAGSFWGLQADSK
jgi:hypothetical protein